MSATGSTTDLGSCLSFQVVLRLNGFWRAPSVRQCIAADRYNDALSLMAQLESRDRSPAHWCTPEILRVKGLIALSGERDEAAAADFFSRSGALARKQGALAWELRAAMNLGKLWAAQQRERDALDLLEPLYGRFTEGFETADLIVARSLIDDLRSPASSRRSPLSGTLPEQT
jgi:hypothetical protein